MGDLSDHAKRVLVNRNGDLGFVYPPGTEDAPPPFWVPATAGQAQTAEAQAKGGSKPTPTGSAGGAFPERDWQAGRKKRRGEKAEAAGALVDQLHEAGEAWTDDSGELYWYAPKDNHTERQRRRAAQSLQQEWVDRKFGQDAGKVPLASRVPKSMRQDTPDDWLRELGEDAR